MADVDSDEPLFALIKETYDQADAALIEFALTTHVSEETRRECQAELAVAKKNNYRINKA